MVQVSLWRLKWWQTSKPLTIVVQPDSTMYAGINSLQAVTKYSVNYEWVRCVNECSLVTTSKASNPLTNL